MKRVILFLMMMVLTISIVSANCGECQNLDGENSCLRNRVAIQDSYFSDESRVVTDKYIIPHSYLSVVSYAEYTFVTSDESTDFDITLGRAILNVDISLDMMEIEVFTYGDRRRELDSVTGSMSYQFNTNTEYEISMERDGFDIIILVDGVNVWTFDYSALVNDAPIELTNEDSIYYGNTNGYVYVGKMSDFTQYTPVTASSSLIVNDGEMTITSVRQKSKRFISPSYPFYRYDGSEYTEYILCDDKIIVEKFVSGESVSFVTNDVDLLSSNAELKDDGIVITDEEVIEVPFSEDKGFLSTIPYRVIEFFRGIFR